MDWVDIALKRADAAKNAGGRQPAIDQRQVRSGYGAPPAP